MNIHSKCNVNLLLLWMKERPRMQQENTSGFRALKTRNIPLKVINVCVFVSDSKSVLSVEQSCVCVDTASRRLGRVNRRCFHCAWLCWDHSAPVWLSKHSTHTLKQTHSDSNWLWWTLDCNTNSASAAGWWQWLWKPNRSSDFIYTIGGCFHTEWLESMVLFRGLQIKVETSKSDLLSSGVNGHSFI